MSEQYLRLVRGDTPLVNEKIEPKKRYNEKNRGVNIGDTKPCKKCNWLPIRAIKSLNDVGCNMCIGLEVKQQQ